MKEIDVRIKVKYLNKIDNYTVVSLGDKMGLIDENKRLIMPCEFEKIENLYGNVVICRKGYSARLYDLKKGKEIYQDSRDFKLLDDKQLLTFKQGLKTVIFDLFKNEEIYESTDVHDIKLLPNVDIISNLLPTSLIDNPCSNKISISTFFFSVNCV